MFALPSNGKVDVKKSKKKKKRMKNKGKEGDKERAERGKGCDDGFGSGRNKRESRSGGGGGGVGIRHQMKQTKKHKRKHGGTINTHSVASSINNHYDNTNSGFGSGKKRKRQSGLQQEFSAKLKGAHFRWLNEQLYTTKGSTAFEMFQDDPDLFHAYHRGFREQASLWITNPLDLIIADLRSMPRGRVIADFGCGEARLAATLNSMHTVHSYDLVAGNDLITACDIANVPLDDDCADVAVFCLALMGVNYVDFLREAHRTLRPGGILKIAEVESRFIHGSDVASKDAGLAAFTRTLELLGFRRAKIDSSHEFFVMFEFVKEVVRDRHHHQQDKKKASLKMKSSDIFELKACRYKKR